MCLVGTGTTEIHITPGFGRVDITRSGCLALPLKSGGKLRLTWNRLSLQGATEMVYGSGWRPAGIGSVFSFLPMVNVYSTNSRRVYSDSGSLDYDTNGIANSKLSDRGVLGTTYFTEFDPINLTYYEYWAGTGFATNAPEFGTVNRKYDLNGNQLLYSYYPPSQYSELSIITGDLAGSVIPYFAYNSGGNISTIHLADQVSPENSRTVYFEYLNYRNPVNNNYPYLSKIISPEGCVRRFDAVTPTMLEAFYNLKREVDPEGYETYFDYPSTFNITSTEPEGRITYFALYRAVDQSTGDKVVLINRNPRYTAYVVTGGAAPMPMITQVTDELGNTTYYQNDATAFRMAKQFDPNGNLTYFTYVGSGDNLYAMSARTSKFNGATSYFGYASSGYQVAKEVGPRNVTGSFAVATYYRYDSRFNRTAVIDPLGGTTLYGRDSLGRIAALQDARGNVSYFNYSPTTGGLDSRVDPDGSVSYFTYNSFLDVMASVSPRWPEQTQATLTTYYTYDKLSRRKQISDPLNNVTYFDWTSRGDLLDTVDAIGTSVAYTYNGLRLMTQRTVTDATGAQLTQEKHGYDIYKNRVRTQDALGNATYYTYDQTDRRTAIQDALSRTTYFSYDSVNNLSTITDARNNRTYYFYDLLSRKTSSRDALGKATYYFYDLADNRTVVVDSRGNVSYFFYDQLDRVQATRDALGNPTYFYFDPAGNQSAVRDALFHSTYYAYDSRNRRTARQDSLGNVTYFAFDAATNLTRKVDARQNSTLYSYDTLDRLQAVLDAVGNSSYFFYDSVGNRTQVRDARGSVSYFFYDGLHRMSGVRDAFGSTGYFFYDAASNRTNTVDALQNCTYFFYDSLNRPSATRDALGNMAYFFYDEVSNQKASLNGLFHATYYSYDALNRLSQATDALGGSTYFEFDAVSNPTKVVDANNHATQVRYDTLNRQDSVRFADAGSAYYFYDAVSNRSKEIDPRGNTTYYTYDILNRVTGIRNALGKSLYFEYDAVSNTSKFADAEGGSAAYTYDGVNRRTNISYTAAGADVAASLRSNPYYVYDQDSNLTQMGDLWGLHLLGYDADNRLIQHKYPNTSVVYYQYDAVSNVTGRVYPGNAGTAGAAYDAINRQTRVQAPSGAAAYFAYDAASNLTQRFLGNSVKQDVTYDSAERISQWRNTNQNGASLTYFDYTRDSKGLITKAVREATHTVYYRYDVNDRIVAEIWAKTGASPSEVYGYRYAYDLAGNRTKVRANGSNTYYFYDKANQLTVQGTTSAYATPTYYIYDKNGSLTNLVEPSGATYFAYNAAGLLARMKWKDLSATYFFYDGNLQRYAMVAAGATVATYFLWDGPNLLQELNADGTVKEEHTDVRTPIAGIGQLVETNRPGQAQAKLYPVMDPRGTITKWIQSDGATVFAAREYEAFGNLIPNSTTGTWPGRWGYQGQTSMEIFSGNGSQRLLLSPTRLYDPVTGRFIQNEPLLRRRPLSNYLYVAQNPVRLVDPLGLQGAHYSGNGSIQNLLNEPTVPSFFDPAKSFPSGRAPFTLGQLPPVDFGRLGSGQPRPNFSLNTILNAPPARQANSPSPSLGNPLTLLGTAVNYLGQGISYVPIVGQPVGQIIGGTGNLLQGVGQLLQAGTEVAVGGPGDSGATIAQAGDSGLSALNNFGLGILNAGLTAWQLPTTSIGLLYGLGNVITSPFGNPIKFEYYCLNGTTFLLIEGGGLNGNYDKSLGGVILMADSNLGNLQHEGAHGLYESQVLGPLYLPAVAGSYAIQGFDQGIFEEIADDMKSNVNATKGPCKPCK
jgi:RHS repeat-associated protein